MGLGGRVIPDEDFFANASIGQKLALVLRGWIVRFYGAPAEAAVATEARIFGVQFLNSLPRRPLFGILARSLENSCKQRRCAGFSLSMQIA